jgi:quinol monooxygenase YgiN
MVYWMRRSGMTLRRAAVCGQNLSCDLEAGFLRGGRSPFELASQAGVQFERVHLVIFARFHARDGEEDAVANELREIVPRVRIEPGCVSIETFRAVRDTRLFLLHSRWIDEAAFDQHAQLPATIRFVERVQCLIDHPFDVTRARAL